MLLLHARLLGIRHHLVFYNPFSMAQILLRYGTPCSSVLEQDKQNRVPNDALENYNLDHQAFLLISIHGLEERNPHHERARKRGEREERDGPVEASASTKLRPQKEGQQDHRFRNHIRRDEQAVHLQWIDPGNELEGEEWNREDGHEAVDARALLGSERLAPPHRGKGQEHGDVQRHNCTQHIVEIS